MSKKENFGQAMHEMFGVGKEPGAAAGASAAAEIVPMDQIKEEGKSKGNFADFTTSISTKSYGATYLAEGTMMKGTLQTKGDVEIAGEFEGDIISKGKVVIHSNITSNITAVGLLLVDCNLRGNAKINGDVTLNENSTIQGNIHAENMACSGRIIGDLDIQGNLSLDACAQIDGNIKVDTLSVSRGAKISGTIEMRTMKKN